jgi:hypothetical protein
MHVDVKAAGEGTASTTAKERTNDDHSLVLGPAVDKRRDLARAPAKADAVNTPAAMAREGNLRTRRFGCR